MTNNDAVLAKNVTRLALINASLKLKKVIYIGHRLKPIRVLFLNLSHSWFIYFSSSTNT